RVAPLAGPVVRRQHQPAVGICLPGVQAGGGQLVPDGGDGGGLVVTGVADGLHDLGDQIPEPAQLFPFEVVAHDAAPICASSSASSAASRSRRSFSGSVSCVMPQTVTRPMVRSAQSSVPPSLLGMVPVSTCSHAASRSTNAVSMPPTGWMVMLTRASADALSIQSPTARMVRPLASLLAWAWGSVVVIGVPLGGCGP